MYDPTICQQESERTDREPDLVLWHNSGKRAKESQDGAEAMPVWLRLLDADDRRVIEDASVAVKQGRGDDDAAAVVKSGTTNMMKVKKSVVKIGNYALNGKPVDTEFTNAAYKGLRSWMIDDLLKKIKELNGNFDEEVPEGLGE